jgi:hypothetical protein
LVFGPFGGNDYNAMVLFGLTVDQARNYTCAATPNIVASGVEVIITNSLESYERTHAAHGDHGSD